MLDKLKPLILLGLSALWITLIVMVLVGEI